MHLPISLTVVFPCVTIFIIIIFYAAYFSAQRARPGTTEWIDFAVASQRARPLHRFPLEKKDIFPVLIITIVYALTAFIGLGDMHAPQTFYQFSDENPSITIELENETELGSILYYTGLVHGHYNLEVSQDNEIWKQQQALGNDKYAMDQSHADLFKWRYATINTMNPPVKYIRITASQGGMQLGEMAIFDVNGNSISPEQILNRDKFPAFFDEQEFVPVAPSYLNGMYFDEIYHARTAYEHFTGEYPYEITHPPLGKLIISIGISLFGMTPFGWRFMGTLFGVLMVAVLYIFLKRLFGKTPVAVCGTLLFAFDFMHFTQTRIATIDTYSVFFILFMYFFMYCFITVPYDAPYRKTILPLFLCGLSFGLGAACKWTSLYAGAGLALICIIYLISRGLYFAKRKEENLFIKYLIKTLLLSVLFFVIIPSVIYYLSYIPYGLAKGLHIENGMLFQKQYFDIVLDNQKYMYQYHSELVAEHVYSASWYEWLLNLRPILYYVNHPTEGVKSSFGAFGNPILWWGGLIGILVMIYRLLRYKDKKAGFILIGYLSQLLPWIFISRPTFAYHYFPSTLFLTLAMAHVFNTCYERCRGNYKFGVIGVTCLSIALFVLFYPVLSGVPVQGWYSSHFLHWLPRWPF